MKHDTIEIRVTRPTFYSGVHQNSDYQQGHYFTGITYNDAVAKAKKACPNEPLNIRISRRFIDNQWVKE